MGDQKEIGEKSGLLIEEEGGEDGGRSLHPFIVGSIPQTLVNYSSQLYISKLR